MRIDLMEHGDLIRGVAEVEDSSDGVRCRRMTAEAMALYTEPERFLRRTYYTAGVRLALVTDSSFIAVRLKLGLAESADAYRVDVLIDRSECHTFSPDEDLDEFQFTVELPDDGETDHEVEILLPIDSQVSILDFELADGALFRPLYCSDERLLFLGDSITMGSAASSPLRSYAAYLAAALNTDYLNWGVGGARMQAELGELALALEWQKVIVAYGINDYNLDRSAKECAAELTGILKSLASRPGVKLYVVTPLVWPAREGVVNKAGDTPDDFRRELAAAAGAFPEATVVNGPAMMRGDEECFVEDGLHPSDVGMTCIAENLYPIISQ